jgi:hypothetical protein
MLRFYSFILAFVVSALAISPASAQSMRLKSAALNDAYINIEKGPVAISSVGQGWNSAMWTVENIGTYVRIKNVWQGTYLNNEHGKLEAGPIQPGWNSAMWIIEPGSGSEGGYFRIKNLWTMQYLSIQGGVVTLGENQPGSRSSLWTMPPSSAPALVTVDLAAGKWSTESGVITLKVMRGTLGAKREDIQPIANIKSNYKIDVLEESGSFDSGRRILNGHWIGMNGSAGYQCNSGHYQITFAPDLNSFKGARWCAGKQPQLDDQGTILPGDNSLVFVFTGTRTQ